MLYTVKNYDDLEQLNELVSLQSQVKALRLQDELGNQKFHEVMKKAFETITKTIEDVSQDVRKTMAETSKENDEALAILNNTLLIIMNYWDIIASFLLSPLSKITNPEHTSQFKLVKDPGSNGLNLLINKTIPVTL